MNEYGFVAFCEREKERIFSAIILAAKNIPPKMNLPDYRFQINNLFCHAISREFSLGGEGGTLRSAYSAGYDMLYADKAKISVKIQQQIFQKHLNTKKGGLTCPQAIVMKNCLGENVDSNIPLDLDFLMTIQRGKNHCEKMQVGFGIIGRDKLINFVILGDQIKIKIPNENYDYFSELKDVFVENDLDRNTELNRVFSEGLSNTYDKLLSIK